MHPAAAGTGCVSKSLVAANAPPFMIVRMGRFVSVVRALTASLIFRS